MSTLSGCFQGVLPRQLTELLSSNSFPQFETAHCDVCHTAQPVPESLVRTPTELLSFFGTNHDSCNRTCLLFIHIHVRTPKQATHSKESQTSSTRVVGRSPTFAFWQVYYHVCRLLSPIAHICYPFRQNAKVGLC